MAAYHELVKNFEKVRAYMREFYVYGFKSRTEYDARSARSYDNERRRLESWLGDHMRFTQTPEGKNVFLSVDSRVTRKNPFYRAWKSKSFTDGDITLHFAIFDILYAPEIRKTLSELVRETDELLSSRMTFDESTLRKKLKEYAGQGIIRTEKEGRRVLYSRAPDTDLSRLNDVIDFFSEAAPCGVVGSFLQDRQPEHPELFSFKHHYITQAMDSDVMAMLFEAMGPPLLYHGGQPGEARRRGQDPAPGAAEDLYKRPERTAEPDRVPRKIQPAEHLSAGLYVQHPHGRGLRKIRRPAPGPAEGGSAYVGRERQVERPAHGARGVRDPGGGR